MAENALPFSDQSNSAADWKNLVGAIARSGVISGLAVSAPGGMSVAVAAGMALVEGFFYQNTSSKTISVNAAPGTSGQTRRDYVILRLDVTAKTITALVKAGTANGSGGTLPALTRTATVWEFPIAVITVANSTAGITSGMIAVLAAGIPVPVIPYANEAARPTPDENALGLNLETQALEVYSGGSWTAIVVNWAGIGGKPSTFPPAAHTHPAEQISDSTAYGRGLLTAANRTAARNALGFYEGTGPGSPTVGDIRFRDQ